MTRVKSRLLLIFGAGVIGALLCLASPVSAEPPKPAIDADGTLHVPSFAIPFSSLASSQAKDQFLDSLSHPPFTPPENDYVKYRENFDKQVKPRLENLRKAFPVTIMPELIGGVQTDIVTPEGGVSGENKDRILINLHGGYFLVGGRYQGQLESIPIASLGRISVVTVDYRMGPEHHFPAASEDVASVYRDLLKRYSPDKIGIYGCSAGGILTAEAVAWFQAHDLPRPGAVGIFCAGALFAAEGDSLYVANILNGHPVPSGPFRGAAFSPYLGKGDFKDPLVSPVFSPTVLAKFPPTLFITGTRDAAMSDAAYTHAQLRKAGVEADLNVWDGMGHSFFNTDRVTPEVREAWDVIVKFFDTHLGRK
jgi:acetyl esterase/lipase